MRALLARVALRVLAVADAERERQLLAACARRGDHVRLRMPVVIYEPERLSLGTEVDIGEFVVLRASGGLRIGDRVLVAAHAVITTRGHPDDAPRWGKVVDAPVVIEDDVWVGAASVILPGVVVGRGAIVAAGAVVTSAVEPYTVVAGVPARVIKRISEPERPV